MRPTGCIGIVLAKCMNLLTQRDINEAALDMTKINCRENDVESEIIKSDCFENIGGTFDTIVINPPSTPEKRSPIKCLRIR